jgi:hypothetical protein
MAAFFAASFLMIDGPGGIVDFFFGGGSGGFSVFGQ